MTADDVAGVAAAAAIAFPDHPEPAAVFAARAALPDAVALVLDAGDGAIAGYLLAHRWPPESVPPLGHAPTAGEAQGAGWYLSDLAVLPVARGAGHTAAALDTLFTRTDAPIALVAVNGSAGFWQRHGFVVQETPAGKLASYGAGACYMIRLA